MGSLRGHEMSSLVGEGGRGEGEERESCGNCRREAAVHQLWGGGGG